MPSRERVNAFVAEVCAGRYVEAIAEFYWPDSSMRENTAPPRVGRDQLIAHENAVLAASGGMRTCEAAPVLVDGDRVVIRWVFEAVAGEAPARRLEELALQTWRGERIAQEQFFYDPGQLA